MNLFDKLTEIYRSIAQYRAEHNSDKLLPGNKMHIYFAIFGTTPPALAYYTLSFEKPLTEEDLKIIKQYTGATSIENLNPSSILLKRPEHVPPQIGLEDRTLDLSIVSSQLLVQAIPPPNTRPTLINFDSRKIQAPKLFREYARQQGFSFTPTD